MIKPYLLHLLASAAIALLLTNCQEKDILDDNRPNMVKAELELGLEPPVLTRGTTELSPDIENLIYDIWIIQYNSSGILLSGGTAHYRTDVEAGSQKVNQEIKLVESANSTVCIIANLHRSNGNAVYNWPDNLLTYKRTTIDLTSQILSAATGTLKSTPMSGYWIGSVTEGTRINASIGRMLTRLNVTLTNTTANNLENITVDLKNVPIKSYCYPQINGAALSNTDYLEDTTPLSNSISLLAPSESTTLYYYIAPNVCDNDALVTSLEITANDKAVNGSVILGNDAPGKANRDFTLYANNIYNFTINLTAK